MNLLRVKKFGIELEGGWDEAPRDYDRFHSDASVSVPGEWKVGEIVSPILTTWSEGSEFIAENYPDHTGSSCGLHVHMSFGPATENVYAMSLLADSVEFQTRLLNRLHVVGKEISVTSKAFWARLGGENSYCRTSWSPLNVQEQDRYRAVNFAAYHRHKTLEIRVLPMFSKMAISLRMVREVLAFVDSYLDAAIIADTAQPAEARESFPMSSLEPVTETINREVY